MNHFILFANTYSNLFHRRIQYIFVYQITEEASIVYNLKFKALLFVPNLSAEYEQPLFEIKKLLVLSSCIRELKEL